MHQVISKYTPRTEITGGPNVQTVLCELGTWVLETEQGIFVLNKPLKNLRLYSKERVMMY